MIIGKQGVKPADKFIEINGVKYTNNYNLPEEIINAIVKDRYTNNDEDPSDFSATRLIAPIQQTILTKRHRNNLKIRDIEELTATFFGSVSHSMIEEASKNGKGLTEKRLYATVLGKTISGKMDRYIDGEIKDWKFTKVYKWQKQDFFDYEAQMNVLKFLLEENGYPVNKISIVMHLKDWSKANRYKPNYPNCQWQVVPIRVWSKEECAAYVTERVRYLIEAEKLNDEELATVYPCSDYECWQEIKDYSIIKIGATKATKCFDTLEEAEQYFQDKQLKFDQYIIEKRMTEKRRCLEFCDCQNHCVQLSQNFTQI